MWIDSRLFATYKLYNTALWREYFLVTFTQNTRTGQPVGFCTLNGFKQVDKRNWFVNRGRASSQDNAY